MNFLKDKQGKDVIIIGILAFIGYKFMTLTSGGLISKPIQKQTI